MSKQKLRFRLLALAVLVFASILSLEHSSKLDAPLVAFLLVASAWTFAIALMVRPEAMRTGALLCSSVLFSLAVVEISIYYVTKSQIIITQTTPAMRRRNAMDIGSLPLPNRTTEFKEFLNGHLITDVTYRIGAGGLREIPAAVQGHPHKVAFFGCSFMFGHGVENEQTLPYYFVQDAMGTFEGFNFAGEGGVHIRCSGRLRPASFAGWQVRPIWLFMRQSRSSPPCRWKGPMGRWATVRIVPWR